MLVLLRSLPTKPGASIWKLVAALLVISLSALLTPFNQASAAPDRPVVLVLVDDLTWDEVENVPNLRQAFERGTVANLSTAQGSTPDDPRFGYLFLGAGARVDTAVLPARLPGNNDKLAGAFDGPASTIRPGALGEALPRAGIQTAAVGEKAALVAMDANGNAARTYDAEDPVFGLKEALEDGANFVAVEAADPKQAGRIAEAARQADTTVAVASPNAPTGSGDLTPFVLDGPDGVLYSPTTRTEALISDADVAPTLLSELGGEPPDGMQGRTATARPGTWEAAGRLDDRLTFVEGKRSEVWVMVGVACVLALLTVGYFRGRTGLSVAVLGVASLPVGALVAAAVPITNAIIVAGLTLLFTAALTSISWIASGRSIVALAGVCLATAALITTDAAVGGALMKLSTLGYNPAYGTRFYGIGNEYSSILAGSLTVGFGALANGMGLPKLAILAPGTIVVIVLGLPTMGADVGGSLALGLGIGATAALIQGGRWRSVVLWAGGGFSVAAALFVLTGIFFPDVSHGSRRPAAGAGPAEIVVRKLILSAEHLLNPLPILLLVAGLVLVYAGWRRTRGTALAAGILAATITAAASGALNDSGIFATLFALAYPAVAALSILLTKNANESR